MRHVISRHIISRKAFTLVELLVVISIIGVLAAILLPAVNAARGAARQTECVNNIRNLAQSVINYEASKSRMPPYAKQVWPSPEPNTATSPRLIAGFVYSILPMFEQSVLRDEIDDLIVAAGGTMPSLDGDHMATLSSPSIKILNCPSNPSLSATPTSGYVANGGHQDFELPLPANRPDARANGAMGFEAYGQNGAITLDYISANDGTTLTAIISENTRFTGDSRGDWRPALVSNTTQYLERVQQAHSMYWHSGLDDPGADTLSALVMSPTNFGGFSNESATGAEASTPSSFHRGGFVVGFADSHVKFLNDRISYRVYSRMLTSDGRNVVVTSTDGAPVNSINYQRLQLSEQEMEEN